MEPEVGTLGLSLLLFYNTMRSDILILIFFSLIQSEGVLTELPEQNVELNPSQIPGEIF